MDNFEKIFFEEKIKINDFIKYIKNISLCLCRSGCDVQGNDLIFSVNKVDSINFIVEIFNILFYRKEEVQSLFVNKIKEIEFVYEK